jgi:hypothetical protein
VRKVEITMQNRKFFYLAIALISILLLSCGITLSGQDGADENGLLATRVALGATQTALANQAAADQPPMDANSPVTFNGVSLVLPPDWTVSGETVPAETAMEAFWSTPQHDRLSLSGYPVENDYHEARIQIFSVQVYRQANELAGERVDELLALLANRPAIPFGALPFLPVFNAAQMGQIRPGFLDFQNGSGLRFLTQFGQAYWPYHNRGLVYAYFGITSDGQYLVSALLPVAHPALEPYTNFQPGEDFYDSAEGLMAEQSSMLNSQPDSSFLPNLTVLDNLIASLLIDK